MSKKLNISKITDKEVILDVQGQDCQRDCVHYVGNQAGGAGCEFRVDSMWSTFM